MIDNNFGTAIAALKSAGELAGFKYSHGNLSELPARTKVNYPLMHHSASNFSLDKQTTTFTFNIAIYDVINVVKSEDDDLDLGLVYEEYGYSENHNYAHVLQELYMRFTTALYKVQQDNYYNVQFTTPIGGDAIIDDGEDMIAGWQITLDVEVLSSWVTDGECDF